MLKSLRIKYSDLDLLTKIFTGTKATIYLFDPDLLVIYDLDVGQEYNSAAPKVLFNFSKDLMRCRELELDDFDQIFDFGSIAAQLTLRKFNFRLVQNEKHDLKWIFKTTDRKQSYLNFFNTQTFKAKFVKWLIKSAARAKLHSIFSNSFDFYTKIPIHCESLYSNVQAEGYSIYCGVPGLLRKPVLQVTSGKKTLAYVKFAVSSSSLKQIEHETKVLKKLNEQQIKHISIPKLLAVNSELAIATSPLEVVYTRKVTNKSTVYRAVKAMSERDVRSQKIGLLSYHREIKNQLSWLKNNDKAHISLQHKLQKLESNLDSNRYVYTSFSHGDFAPWNMKTGAVLGVYDWEMADNERPILHDFFHYILMDELLVKRELTAAQIIGKIKNEAQEPKIKYLIKHFKIDLHLHLELYLVHNISTQLVLMTEGKNLSADHEVLIKGWEAILNEMILEVNFKDHRLTILAQFEKFLKEVPYVALKFLHNRFDELAPGSDLDLLTYKDEIDSILNFFESSMLVENVKQKKLGHMTVLKIFLKNGEFLSVDLIHEFSRKGLIYLDANMIISSAKVVGEIKKPSDTFELLNILCYYFLNKADIPEKYIGFLSSKYSSEFRADIALCNIELYIGIKENEFRNAFKYSSEKRKILINHIKNRHNYNLTARFYRRLKYVLRQFINLLSPKGTIITFSGVDGAGKTTVINEVIDALKNKYRKEVVYLHQRPGILPILSAIKYGSIEKAEKVSADALPRQGTNRSKLSSILRFSYYYIDYVIGQAVVRFKYLSRDKVVIYDRYYFDFINDAKRSNINLNRSFIKKMYAFITKPAYNFYLYNEPRVILKRKRELSSKEISELNKNYKTLFSEYVQNGVKGKYIQLKNDELPDTINRVMNQLKNIA